MSEEKKKVKSEEEKITAEAEAERVDADGKKIEKDEDAGLLPKMATAVRKYGPKLLKVVAVAGAGMLGYVLGSKSGKDDDDVCITYLDDDSADDGIGSGDEAGDTDAE